MLSVRLSKWKKLVKFIHEIDSDFKYKFLMICSMSIFMSILEIFCFASFLPFISVISNTSLLHTNKYLNYLYVLTRCNSNVTFLLWMSIAIVNLFLLRGLYTLWYQWKLNKFIFGLSRDITIKMYEKSVKMSYRQFLDTNTSKIRNLVLGETDNVVQIASRALSMVTETFTVLLIYFGLLVFNLKITLIITICFIVIVLILIRFISRYLKNIGIKTQKLRIVLYEKLHNTVGNFKLIKLYSNENSLIKKYYDDTKDSTDMFTINCTFQQLPRVILELIGFTLLITIVIFYNITGREVSSVIPILTMYALSFYKLLPSINILSSGYNQIMFLSSSISLLYNEMFKSVPLLGDDKITFSKEIKITNLSFKYDDKLALDMIDLSILRGSKVGFVGSSGSGKTTLVDLIMGILPTQSGAIYVDDVELNNLNITDWKNKIGYIPQNIYLFEGTIAENIAFGHVMNESRVIYCMKLANIYDTFKDRGGAELMIGDSGINLSGGQKQRIGIARAIYKDPEILVLDESTSALDMETEQMIMEEIYKISSNKTLLIIAHKKSTLSQCNYIVTLNKGKIKSVIKQ